MNPGRMDEYITLESVSETRDAVGQPIESWSTLAQVWAEVIPNRGQERFTSSQRFAEADYEFRIHYRTDVTTKHRITWQSVTHDILAVYEPDWAPRASLLVIVAKRRNA